VELSAVIELLSGVVQRSGIGSDPCCFFPTLMNWLKYWNALVLQLNCWWCQTINGDG